MSKSSSPNHSNRRVPFYRHDLGQAELEKVAEVLRQPILTTGHLVAEFETRFASLLGVRHVLALTSCTAAIQLALHSLGIGPGDEVITTPMTFIASATGIMQAGARPIFADVEPGTGNLDVEAIHAAITPRTKAILPVHLYGQMCDMRAMRALADRHGLAIVEDCAHCVEGSRDGVRPAQLSEAACFSFFATKNMTCGEGGAIAFNDTGRHEGLKLLRLHGMDKTADDRHRDGYQHWDMVQFGWKYNMSNIEAALLLPQFDRLAAKLEKRDALAQRYRDRLSTLPGVRLPAIRPGLRHAWHLMVIWVETGRDEVLASLARLGVEATVNYRPVHLTTYFSGELGHRRGDFPVAERLGDSCISLPFYPDMSFRDVDYVCDCLKDILR